MDVCNWIQMVHLKCISIIATPALSFVNDHGNLHKQKFLSCVEMHGLIVSQIHLF